MRKFVLFFIMWIASNLSIPFWAVGHIHLTMNVYEDIKEIKAEDKEAEENKRQQKE